MVAPRCFWIFAACFRAAATKEPLLGRRICRPHQGFGLGLVYSTGATNGGIDIVAKFLRRRYPYINFGTLILALDCGRHLAICAHLPEI
jgi:uncharacterized membrane-anchored protein YitT (DUF2179 family)